VELSCNDTYGTQQLSLQLHFILSGQLSCKYTVIIVLHRFCTLQLWSFYTYYSTIRERNCL